MELMSLKYFCYAAEAESFSRTAEHFTVPTSNISQIIKRLEEELGVKLFDRSGNRVKLNESGRRLYLGAKQALATLEDTKRSLTTDESEEGEIKLLILNNRRRVADIIEHFGKTHPAVTFSIAHKLTGSPADYDIIISDTLPYLKGYAKELFVKERLALATEGSSPLTAVPNITSQMLSQQKYITMLEDSSLYKATADIFKGLGISPKIIIKCDDPAIIHRYVEMGLGVAIIPSVSWSDVFSDGVKVLDIGDFFRESYIFSKECATQIKRVSLFLDELKNHKFVDFS